jgi:iron complex outermembrane recepter protein
MRNGFLTALAASAATLTMAVVLATPVMAQSTGSVDFEQEIIVTGARSTVQEVAGISSPDTAKAKAVLTQENIARQNPGQSILDTINQVPGVSFQNNDAYGSAGGTLNIRGFSSDRVSLTFDGVPLNDSGNYAIFSNQQVDPEVIEQVNVNLGTTDVDSPTASAAGGTVNLRTKTPDRDRGVMLAGSVGQFNFYRVFAKVESGDLTPSGLRAYIAGSHTENRVPFNNYGKINKYQANAKVYLPLSGNDFIAIAGHYNRNRNNFFGSLPLRTDTTRLATVNGVPNTAVPRIVGSQGQNRYPTNPSERRYSINFPCTVDTAQPGVADVIAPSVRPDGTPDVNGDFASCGNEFDRRYNPSDTGNIRLQSRFTLADNIILTIDPSIQFVKANGGGTVSAREGLRDIDPGAGVTNVAGYLGGTPFFGRDINGDGDVLDTVLTVAPSQTATRRIGLIAGLRWDVNDQHTLRMNYTFDRARHRQTGEVALLKSDGEPVNVFAIDAAEKDVNGAVLQKRDRLSLAILHQFSAEYRGDFMDDKLTVTAGLRMPFFKRDLTNNCFTSSAAGFVECFGTNTALNATAATLNPYTSATNASGALIVGGWSPPQQRVLNYKKALPNVGLVFDVTENASVFGNFSQGISVPGTDNLYNAFFFPFNTARARPTPETTNNFDFGFRYRSGTVQGQVSAFYNQFKNRLAQAFDPEINQTVYRNLGNVKKYGLDGSIAWQPVPEFSVHAFGSVMKSEIRDNLVIAENLDGSPVFAETAGKREAGAPKYTLGFSARGLIGPVELGLTAKRTGERFIYDTNEATFTGTATALGAKACPTATTCVTPTATTARTQIFGPTAPAYWLVNLDARFNLGTVGLPENSHLQLNVYNLFNQFYVGGFGGNLNQNLPIGAATGIGTYGNPGFVQIGAPRTLSATLVVSF